MINIFNVYGGEKNDVIELKKNIKFKIFFSEYIPYINIKKVK